MNGRVGMVSRGPTQDETAFILNGDSTTSSQPRLRWKPIPIAILAAAVVYSVTVAAVSVTVVVVNQTNAAVARACIQAGGSWSIDENGQRECAHEARR